MGKDGIAATATAGIAAARSDVPAKPSAAMSPERLRRAAGDFEAFFLARALEPMFAGIGSEPPFGGGMGEQMWRSLLIDEYGKALAKAGGIGIADAVVRDLIGVQEHAHAPAAEAEAAGSPPAKSTKTEITHR
jgi:flagellar protein FlgJ